MRCPKCQRENPADAKFCNECGHKFIATCPTCGKMNPPDSKFCNECGENLKENKESPAIDFEKPKSYTPKHLADKILTTRSSLEGERKIVTVMFADVANYTSMSEKLDPEEVLQIMEGAFKIMMDETHKYEGTINQFTGDGIMAIFGAPVAHENHTQRACYSALSIQKAMRDYSAKIEKNYGLDFKIRIGINTGPVIVSAIGDDLRMDYTAVGDTTNLASRMESQAKPGTVFVSGNTHKIVERYFDFNPLGKTEVKGKEEPQEIYELLKAGEVVTRIDESIAKGLTRFVGRKNSMAALMNAFDLVQSGSGQVVGVVGEAGVGKSRLILELQNRLPEKEYTYLEGQCLQYGGTILYMPILDIVRSCFDIKDDDREHIINKKVKEKILSNNRNLEHTLPPIQDLLSVVVKDETFLKLEPKQKRERIFEAIRDIFICISEEKPLIIVIEDLHWIDDTSQEFIDYFIEWMANTPILLILLYRTEYRHSWGSKTYYHRIGLDHLRKESAIELITAMLKEGNVATELRDLILNRAAGNPLFMEELTYTLIENGTIQKKANQYVLSRQVSDIQVPNTVQDIIAARMDRLEENLKRTMQVASVIGRDFAFRILQTITGMHEELKSYLRNLQGLEFIYEKNLFPELEYIFKHALTQEVAYNSLLLKRRKQIHENIGKAIEEIYTERLVEFYEMLAYHYSKSDNLGKAFLYLKLSGEKAWSNYANEVSLNFYDEAIKIIHKLPKTEHNKRAEIEVSLLAYNPIALLSFPDGSLEIFQTGEKLSKEIKDKKSLSYFCSYISIYFAYKGNPIDGIKYTEPKFFQAQKDEDIDLIAPLTFGLVLSYFTVGDFSKVVNVAPKVIDMLKHNKKEMDHFGLPVNLYSWLCTSCGYSFVLIGDFEKGKNFLEEALASAKNGNDKRSLSIIEFHIGQYHYLKGDGKNTIDHCNNGIKYGEETNYPWMIGLNFALSGEGYRLLGDLENAKKQVERGYNFHKDTPADWLSSYYPLFLSYVYHDSDDHITAKRYAEEALELSSKNNERWIEARSMIWLGRTIGKGNSSKNEEAEKYISQGITILKEIKLRPYVVYGYFFLGELYANTGRKDEALKNLNKALSMCQEMGIGYWPDKIKEVLDRL